MKKVESHWFKRLTEEYAFKSALESSYNKCRSYSLDRLR